MDQGNVRKVLLDVIRVMAASDAGAFGRYEVLKHAGTRLAANHDPRLQRFVLDGWDNLYRIGIISWGLDVGSSPNASSEWANLTGHVVQPLKTPRRDPANPLGYREAIV